MELEEKRVKSKRTRFGITISMAAIIAASRNKTSTKSCSIQEVKENIERELTKKIPAQEDIVAGLDVDLQMMNG